MTAKRWTAKIKQATIDAGTYKPFFDSVIKTLAEIMEIRDDAIDKFKASGGNAIELSAAGTAKKNPALVVIDDMNKTALQYWRDLGLTPAGLKRINEEAMNAKKSSSFSEALRGLEL